MKQKTVMIIDGQGGGLGKAVIEKIKKSGIAVHLLAVGTNTAATSVMLKAGADEAATGENAVIYNAAFADYIVGGIGIIAANSMLGEISPSMATAVSSSRAVKILIPVSKCIFVAGVRETGLSELIDEVLSKIEMSITR